MSIERFHVKPLERRFEMFDPVVIAALVELVYVLVQQFLPGFPISKELINAIIIALLGLFAFKAAVQPLVRKFMPKLNERGLLSKD